jgi:hypothetical protein
VILATNDKDLFQLVDGCVTGLLDDKSEPGFAEGFARRSSVPTRCAEMGSGAGANWRCPRADRRTPVDNIPGVPGFRPKTAEGLLKEFGSLDAVLADLSAVKSEKLRAKLEQARPQIIANREMVRLGPVTSVCPCRSKNGDSSSATMNSFRHCGVVNSRGCWPRWKPRQRLLARVYLRAQSQGELF